ncbi:hypothetical protein D9M73_70730 [compost metagenome]
MTEPEPELFVPRPGSVLWRMLTYLLDNQAARLTRQDVSTMFDCALGGVDTLLQKPTARECLVKSRNSKNQMVWGLGLVKRFRLDPLPGGAPAAPAEPYRAINNTAAPPAKWTATPRPTGPAPFPGEAAARAAPAPAAPRPPAIKVVEPPVSAKQEAEPAKGGTDVQDQPVHSAAVFRLPASTTFNAEQALQSSIADELDHVLIAGYSKTGVFCVRSSRMTCAEAAFLANKMLAWALSGGNSAQ